MTTHKWSPQQDAALQAVSRWFSSDSKQVFYLAGYAGTGKTTLTQHLVGDISGLVLFAAYTGKAASVLRQRGCPEASTLHSFLYDVMDADRTRLYELAEMLKDEDLDEEEREKLRKEYKAEKAKATKPRFAVNPESIIKEAELVVLDECSMVDRRLAEDLLSFGVKVLVLGDPAQLPPVKGTGYFTSRRPDILLTEIHRQARDNPIIRYSQAVREGRNIPYGDHGEARKVRKGEMGPEFWKGECGQVLTGKNENRRKLNQRLRRLYGYSEHYPEQGEKLVILKNDKQLGVLNGVLCTATSDAELDESGECLVVNLQYEGLELEDVLASRAEFDQYADADSEDYDPVSAFDRLRYMPMDFGYALTVHKAQGSQWPSVTLCDDGFGRSMGNLRAQWLYTAITRAQNNLTIIS